MRDTPRIYAMPEGGGEQAPHVLAESGDTKEFLRKALEAALAAVMQVPVFFALRHREGDTWPERRR